MRRTSAGLGIGLLVVSSAALAWREKDLSEHATNGTAKAPSESLLPTASTGPTPADASGKPAETHGSEPSLLGTALLGSALPGTAEPAGVLPAKETNGLAAPVSFQLLPDGNPPPPLDGGAPKRVKLGVVLFRYRGAEGATPTTRTKAEALALARTAVLESGGDFARLAERGDPGSSVDVGWVGRGVLERGVEYPLFTLPVGETLKEPLDTPRGYWVVRRYK